MDRYAILMIYQIISGNVTKSTLINSTSMRSDVHFELLIVRVKRADL